ncbi:DUF4097 family beta strand repeat-containing protein [Actinoplanes sp. NPDC049668]|uniref:DUF4097 family beta strand repeat-containing protein n=1 Tax=unclassified Actinoplanes TaxID=2626549 RepID=UPI0033B6FD15
MPEFDHATPVTVSLRLQRGEADVYAEPRQTVRVDVTEAGADASETFTVRLEGDTLIVHAPEGAPWQWRYPKTRVVVRVPEGSSLAMKSASADVRAVGRYATVQASLQSADAEVDRVDGDASLKAASGDLKVAHVGGALRLGSSSGDVEVGDVIGDVSVDTASGDITIRAAGASVQAESASGDIEVGVLRRGRARIKTASGDVSVGVAAGTGVWLDLSTASGSTSNDLSMGATPPGGEQQATLELGVRTASGDIDVHRAAGATPLAA